MMEGNGTTAWQATPAGQHFMAQFAQEKTLQSIERLLARMEVLEKAVDNLTLFLQQGPGMLAMMADMVDDTIRNAKTNGIDLEERMQTIAYMADRLTEPGMAEKFEGLMELADKLPGLIGLMADSFDEGMKIARSHGFDAHTLAEVAGQANTALTNAKADPPERIRGLLGINRALKDPDRQRGMAFLLNFLKYYGKSLNHNSNPNQ